MLIIVFRNTKKDTSVFCKSINLFSLLSLFFLMLGKFLLHSLPSQTIPRQISGYHPNKITFIYLKNNTVHFSREINNDIESNGKFIILQLKQ